MGLNRTNPGRDAVRILTPNGFNNQLGNRPESEQVASGDMTLLGRLFQVPRQHLNPTPNPNLITFKMQKLTTSLSQDCYDPDDERDEIYGGITNIDYRKI